MLEPIVRPDGVEPGKVRPQPDGPIETRSFAELLEQQTVDEQRPADAATQPTGDQPPAPDSLGPLASLTHVENASLSNLIAENQNASARATSQGETPRAAGDH
jgi:hypothetical protein